MHSSLCILVCFVFVFGVCCCSLVAAGTCKADKHPTQPGICIEHTLVEEAEEKRGGGIVCGCAWLGVVLIFFFFISFFKIFFCNCSVLCVRVGWVGARALDKEKKSGKNKEKDKSEARK